MPAIPSLRRRHVVYVDAKITGMHDTALQRKAFVGYVVEGRKEPPGFLQVPATETDEAEEQAILFAITELKDHLKRFTVICDHESAVIKVNRKGGDRKKAKKDKVLPEIWKVLDESRSIKVRALGGNPAHGLLNKAAEGAGHRTETDRRPKNDKEAPRRAGGLVDGWKMPVRRCCRHQRLAPV